MTGKSTLLHYLNPLMIARLREEMKALSHLHESISIFDCQKLALFTHTLCYLVNLEHLSVDSQVVTLFVPNE